MKIAIDISQIVYGTGVSNYTKELVKNILKADSVNEYILFGGTLRQSSSLKEFFGSISGDFSSKIVPIPPTLADIIWNRLHSLPIEKLVGNIDVFHSSDWTQPPSSAFKVTTIHDLAPIRFPKMTHRRIYEAHKARFGWVKKEVDRIVVPSNATKEELLSFGVDKARIRVIPEAPSDIFYERGEEQIKNLRAKYGIFGKFVISVGLGPRKNTERLIKAFDLVRKGDLKLVLIGSPQEKVIHTRNIRVLGHVPSEELPALYRAGEALVYPSLYEGFGLPILEAFASGTPVVTSNLSSMVEVAGSAAVLVDPYQVESIVEGISKALRGKIGLSKKGLAQVRKFSWEKTAKMTLAVYDEAKK
ncbi:MAG: glycosyltransferase family 1 protein [Patescibacteria group bacterium]